MFPQMARDLIDPATRKSVAFYVAVGVAGYDAVRNGLHLMNGTILASAAGIGAFGVFAILARLGRDPK